MTSRPLKGGTSPADAFGKICVDYRRAAKSPMFQRAEVLETYPEHPPVPEECARRHREECAALRLRALAEEDYSGLHGAELLLI